MSVRPQLATCPDMATGESSQIVVNQMTLAGHHKKLGYVTGAV